MTDRALPALLLTALLSSALTALPASARNAKPADGIAIRPELPRGTPQDIAGAAKAGKRVLSLDEALQRAYWTNPTLLAQRANVRSSDYGIPQARSAYGPKLSYEVSYGRTFSGSRKRGDAWDNSRSRSATATAILTQPLLTFGRNAAAERVAVAQLGYQRQLLRSAEQQAMYDAITAYVELLRDRAGVAIARDNVETLERELSDNRARFSKREVTATDVQQVETRVELGRAQLYSAQGSAAASEATFLRVVGAPAGQLAAPEPLPLPVRTLDEAYSYAESHNPILIAAQQREKVSRASLASTRTDLLPRVDLRGQAELNRSWDPPSILNTTGRSDGREIVGEVVVSGPLYDSGLREARIGEAAAANDADWRLIDAALRENRESLASAWDDWKSQSAAIDRYAAAVASAQAAYDGALLQEKAGMRTTLDVLDLARELLLARSNYVAAIAGAYVSQARVLAGMGALEQSWLLPDAPRYDAERHFDKVDDSGDIPLLTPIMRILDGAPLGSRRDRPSRDPAAPLTTPPVNLDPVKEVPVP